MYNKSRGKDYYNGSCENEPRNIMKDAAATKNNRIKNGSFSIDSHVI